MRIILLFISTILTTSHSYAWEIKANFETGAIGTTASAAATLAGTDAFHSTADGSKYVSSPVSSGAQAGSVTVKKGKNGFGSWGGAFKFPEELSQGDNIWFKVNVFYPTGWTFDCGNCSQGMKFMRIHTADSAGKNEGYHSTLIKGGSTGGLITVDSEVNGTEFQASNEGPDWRNDQRKGLGIQAPRGQWITYEMQIKFHSTSGQGVYRVWQNGTLIFEDLETATLRKPTSKSDLIYLYTYWNNGAPVTQTSYVDDIIITNIAPAKKDSHGNSFIGTGSLVYTAPPKSPTILQSQ